MTCDRSTLGFSGFKPLKGFNAIVSSLMDAASPTPDGT